MNIRQNLRTRCARLAMLAAWLFASAVTANAATAELTLPPIFANEMILRDKPVNVWGKSFAGDTITVSFGDATVKTTGRLF